MSLRLGDTAPNFRARTTAGDLDFYEYLGDSRLVDAHVRRLRVKIEDHPDDPKLIVTARGIGYRLLA